MRVTRLIDAPIITPDLHPSIGENIQGPSLIRVPDRVEAPLGSTTSISRTTAEDKGSYIRLVYAVELYGPWKVYPSGSLQIAATLSYQTFHYPDFRAPLGKAFNAFGFDRCMWGTDWTGRLERAHRVTV